ncbi:MAG TPA: hypothetical protein VGK38_11470 [Prolixibacteraceae bacterium]|jgi:hypothetical protein
MQERPLQRSIYDGNTNKNVRWIILNCRIERLVLRSMALQGNIEGGRQFTNPLLIDLGEIRQSVFEKVELVVFQSSNLINHHAKISDQECLN